MLDSKACEIANFLTEKGYGAVYLPGDAYGDLCTRCLLCAKNCPAGAIPRSGDFPPSVDKRLCAIRFSKGYYLTYSNIVSN